MKRFLTYFALIFLIVAAIYTPVLAQAVNAYDPAEEGIVSAYYPIDTEKGFIYGITPGTSCQKLLHTCVPAGLSASAEILATGTQITGALPDGTPLSMTAVVTGDLNGDGGITITDMLMVKSAVLGESLTAPAAAAGDLNFDGNVTITDFLKVKSILLGLEQTQPCRISEELFLLTPGQSDFWQMTDAAFYESSDPTLLTVTADGRITAAELEGSCFVYAFSEDGTRLARQLVTVLNEPLTLSFQTSTYGLTMGQSLTLSPVFNHPVTPDISWHSSDETVVTVDNGVLNAIHFGTATVTATLPNGAQIELSVTVAPPITHLAIERTLYKVKPGNSKNLTLMMEPADSGEEIIWTSSDPAIATVSPDGIVTGIAYGTVTVTATGKYSGLSDSCDVKVCDVIQVALTFDDGPSTHTAKLLDFLKENDIRVTFFLVGNRINSYKTSVKREAAEGHEIGYHSYAHDMQTGLSSNKITSDFEKTDKILYNLTGQHFTLWRTPGGDYNSRVVAAVPLPHIMWSEDTADWKTRNAYAVYRAILNQSSDGDIVLMHDLHGFTVEGAIMAMKEMQAGDYEFLTVSEMLSRNGKAPEKCRTYYSGK